MECAIGFVKFLLHIFITTFWCTGLTLIVLSAMVFREVKFYSSVGDFLESHYYEPLITLMVIGTLILVLSSFGNYAVYRENKTMMITFAALIFVLFIFEVTVGSIAFFRSSNVNNNIEGKMRSSLMKYSTDPDKRQAFDAMQRNLECCGVTKAYDYVLVFLNASVPSSCCTKDLGDMCSQHWSSSVIHQTGCFEALCAFIKKWGLVLGSVAVIAAVVGIIGIVVSVFLVLTLKKGKKTLANESKEMGTVDEERRLTGTLEEKQNLTGILEEEHKLTDSLEEGQNPTGTLEEERKLTSISEEEQKSTSTLEEEQKQTDIVKEEQKPTLPRSSQV